LKWAGGGPLKPAAGLIRIVAILVLSALFSCIGFAQTPTAQCDSLIEDKSDYEASAESRAAHQQKVEFALARIADDRNLTDSPECVSKALLFLGTFHIEKAIPRMIELLGFEYKQANPIRMRTRNEVYPQSQVWQECAKRPFRRC